MASDLDNFDGLVTQYKQDGVIRVRQLLSAAAVEEVRRELDRYVRDVVPTLPTGDIVREKDGRSVRNLWRMEAHDRFFAALAERPQIVDLVSRLVGGSPVLLGVETFNKPAKVGSNIPAHQDNAYFCQSPPDVLTVWIAIDEATLENGPVTYYRGSHRVGMLPHKPSGVQGNSMGLAEPFSDGETLVGTLEPGDALIHHCQIVHESAPNGSDRPRCGLLMVYRGKHTQADSKLKEQYTFGNGV